MEFIGPKECKMEVERMFELGNPEEYRFKLDGEEHMILEVNQEENWIRVKNRVDGRVYVIEPHRKGVLIRNGAERWFAEKITRYRLV